MITLGIETSCDETAASIVQDGHQVHSNIIASQVKQHSAYGGVVPELAARQHVRAISEVVDHALARAKVNHSDLNGVAVTSTPGLVPALLVGVSYAKGLSAALGIPLKGINHFIAHIFGALIGQAGLLQKSETFPIMALVVSGGHTALTVINRDGSCHIVGRTLDDAAGEAFDKAAKILNLSYPGGPLIDKFSRRGNPKRYSFPQGLVGGNGNPISPENLLHFSFSGVKTALLYHVKKHGLILPKKADVPKTDYSGPTMATNGKSISLSTKANSIDSMTSMCSLSNQANQTEGNSTDQAELKALNLEKFCLSNGDTPSEFNQDTLDTIASYQEAVVDVLVKKAILAVEKYQANTLVLCGGVACNTRLRHKLQVASNKHSVPLIIAKPEYCTDNAAMIAGTSYYYFKNGDCDQLNLDAQPRLQEFTSVPFVS